ncbi:PREDICTED: EIN3-binding F-box protein 1 [Tarenaya hassleriana]|uniref:EIN3-binding F-box protein 1 n=1 Tax=Tarenaya hassleriana TaxID=28532 RepID=UPI00053C3105|nr:PREDICTED: EIN3-binding F-box protein 1 [Tarenaya hassleriana]
MEEILCDELLQEIFTRLPPSSGSVPMVSKRWLRLYRASKTSLSLRIDPRNGSVTTLLPSLLRHHPFVSALSLVLSPLDRQNQSSTAMAAFSEQTLSMVSSCCSNLRRLRFLIGPVSLTCLPSLSASSSVLTSLSLCLSRPVSFTWVAWFPCLKELSIYVCWRDCSDDKIGWNSPSGSCPNVDPALELGLESVSLSGIGSNDSGVNWLWKSCRKMKRLRLKCCESVGDIACFGLCLKNVEEMELRTCRSIVDVVLLKLSENCDSLNSLLVYDGGSREGLVQFMNNCRCNIQKLDLRLPLDLNDDHLTAIATNFRALSYLKLQSCCLVTGEGLKTLASSLSSSLEELSLVNCDAVERESGLLTTLGQHLVKLKKLELTYNESLPDKEFVSMVGSCRLLAELKLRGCKALTGAALVCLIKSCENLRSIDITDCRGIGAESVQTFLVNCPRLRRLAVEESKLTDDAKTWASAKFIQVVS